MLSVSSRIWTRVTVSISYDDNDYTTGTSRYSGGQPTRPESCCQPMWTAYTLASLSSCLHNWNIPVLGILDWRHCQRSICNIRRLGILTKKEKKQIIFSYTSFVFFPVYNTKANSYYQVNSVTHCFIWFIISITSAKTSGAAELCLMIQKYGKTFDSFSVTGRFWVLFQYVFFWKEVENISARSLQRERSHSTQTQSLES